ncbi:MAG: hypothetical protein FD138_1598 [Planctomycetota bacterium]|nr:MAG: hypothetical protein FD138_1598 [Planctomycetota bacterium]
MERGTTSQAAAATGRLQTVGGFTLPVAAAYAASDVVPAQHTPDGVSDAERHQLADETIGDHECQRSTRKLHSRLSPVCSWRSHDGLRRLATGRHSRRINVRWPAESPHSIRRP